MPELVLEGIHIETALPAVDTLVRIPVDLIDPDPEQPRFEWDTPDAKADLEQLGDSLVSEGQLEPITVLPHPELEGRYMLEDGERRWRAAKLKGMKELDARFVLPDRMLDPTERLIAQLAHNSGRSHTALERMRAYQRLLEMGLSQAEIARRTGAKRATVGDCCRLGELHPVWHRALATEVIQLSHVPILHKYREAEEGTQEAVYERIREYVGEHGRLPIARLEDRADDLFDDPGGAPLDDEEASSWASHERDDVGDEDPAEIVKAHRLALQIDETSGAKERKALTQKLHAMPFWRQMRTMGFDEWVAFTRKRNQLASSSNPEPAERKLCKDSGVPYISSALWRNAPPWVHVILIGASDVFNLEFAVHCRVDVEAGDLLGRQWGSTKADQLKALDKRMEEARGRVIHDRVTFGEPKHDARLATDALIERMRRDRGIERMRSRSERQRPAETPAPDRAPERRAGPTPAAPTRTFTDTERLNAIAQRWWFVTRDHAERWIIEAPQGEFVSATLREAIDGALCALPSEATCIVCGCTDGQACPAGCKWYSVTRSAIGGYGVCSECAPNAEAAKELEHHYVVSELHAGTDVGRSHLAIVLKAREDRAEIGPVSERDDAPPPKVSDDQVQELRAAIEKGEAAGEQLACIYCGCTENNACEGGCGLLSTDPPVCDAPECREAKERGDLPWQSNEPDEDDLWDAESADEEEEEVADAR